MHNKKTLLTLIFFCLPINSYAAKYAIDSDVVGETKTYKSRYEDNLYGLARNFNMGIVEMLVANPHIDDLWMPGAETKITIPAEHVLPEVRSGIVVNLPELRLYYFKDKNTVYTYPVGIGKDGWSSPVGESKITKMRKNPVWIPPDSIRKEKPELPAFVEAGPDNPLGAYAMNTGWKSVVIHGTNTPNGVGLRSSHGCIRMYPEDIEELFNMVGVGTKITFVDKPFKLGWHGKDLFLEVTPTQDQLDTLVKQEESHNPDLPQVREAVRFEAAKHGMDVDWETVDHAIHSRNSLPVLVAEKTDPRIRRLERVNINENKIVEKQSAQPDNSVSEEELGFDDDVYLEEFEAEERALQEEP